MAIAYYNEIDPYAAQWLRNLIIAGHIAPGFVDERSIEDVTPNELRGYTQCHFFAGIGVWSHALRQAGWPDDKPVWTGSCPCQPFSAAGKGGGFDDERHLWPAFHHLIEQCKPATVIGEQVASKDANAWLDLVQVDLEALDYAFGAVPFPSASVGAPHIRDRLYWLADSMHGNGNQRSELESYGWARDPKQNGVGGVFGGVADTEHDGCNQPNGAAPISRGDEQNKRLPHGNSSFGMPIRERPEPREASGAGAHDPPDGRGELPQKHVAAGPTNGFWRDADWLLCRDGKWRPVEPGTFPLAHGATSRVGRLRAYGNAINAKAAQVFIGAYLES